MTVHPITGEILNLEVMPEEELVTILAEIEELYQRAREVRENLQNSMLSRMLKDGATLRVLPQAKVRIHTYSKVRDKKLVEKLAAECPEDFKELCFAYDIRPLKRGLNELAKLGDEWRHKVSAIYQEEPRLKIEWAKQEDEAAATGDWKEPSRGDDCLAMPL